MPAMAKQKVLELVNALIVTGTGLRNTAVTERDQNTYVDHDLFGQFTAGCDLLCRMLGDSPWSEALSKSAEHSRLKTSDRLLGTVKTIKVAIDGGWLLTAEGLIRAEAFSNLLEQAEYLLSEDYYVAAGALGRAVLEEHLRGLCARQGCVFQKARPTINDFNCALYNNVKYLDKAAMKHVDALAAIGNKAAHNDGPVSKAEVERLLRDVLDFMAQHPLS